MPWHLRLSWLVCKRSISQEQKYLACKGSREPNPGLCNMLPSRNGKIVIKAKEFIRKECLAQTEDKVEYTEQELEDPTYKPASESNTEHEDDKGPVRPASLPSDSSCSGDE